MTPKQPGGRNKTRRDRTAHITTDHRHRKQSSLFALTNPTQLWEIMRFKLAHKLGAGHLWILMMVLIRVVPAAAQWSNSSSTPLFVDNGLLPELTSDQAGGCYISFEVNTVYPRGLFIRRLNKWGYEMTPYARIGS